MSEDQTLVLSREEEAGKLLLKNFDRGQFPLASDQTCVPVFIKFKFRRSLRWDFVTRTESIFREASDTKCTCSRHKINALERAVISLAGGVTKLTNVQEAKLKNKS
ncbi:hypothetical protein LOTGIDRAFT_162807 [Lottia gigantea]|uniref:Uncharacterized protein n=1 Tax=Lottia gigantea TaxID=225164 RepID=V4AAN2_LOTGI|nr:hypothetical protein LOTGIDRAFT_162807 [Lottia gigantea]ESO92155.1 hypothetical protein LOTGIDRAFT_162807 [Lottia gigantea]